MGTTTNLATAISTKLPKQQIKLKIWKIAKKCKESRKFPFRSNLARFQNQLTDASQKQILISHSFKVAVNKITH